MSVSGCICSLFARVSLLSCRHSWQRVTALLECGASENFIAESQAVDLGCRRHTLRTHLHVRIANGDCLLCTKFVRQQIYRTET